MFDVLFILVVGLSTAFAALRGGLRELSTILALGAAGGLTLMLAEPVIGILGMQGSFFGAVAIAAGLVAAFFIAGHVGLHFALKRAQLAGWGEIADRVGGGVFGFLRGLILVGLGYLGYSYYLDEARQPDQVKSAITRPLAASVASWFENFAPERAYIEATLPGPGENATVQGYNRDDRNGLKEIVTTVTTTDATEPEATDSSEESTDADANSESSIDEALAEILAEDDE